MHGEAKLGKIRVMYKLLPCNCQFIIILVLQMSNYYDKTTIPFEKRFLYYVIKKHKS